MPNYTKTGWKRIGELLEQRRKNMGLNPREFEKVVGVSASHIRRLEAGLVKEPKRPMLDKIARMLEHTIEEVQAIASESPVDPATRTLTRPEILRIIQHQLSLTETWKLSRDLQDYLEKETSK